jgi:hypothetical protein
MLKHTKELVFVVPVSRNMTTLEVVCTLFHLDDKEGRKVVCRHFDERDKSCPAFKVPTDDDGYFNKESTKEN